MSLTPEQKAIVTTWVTAGDNLSVVQKKLLEHFKITLTYRDVRFLVDDLDLTLKDPAPEADTSDLSKSTPLRKAPGSVPPARSDASLPLGTRTISRPPTTAHLPRRMKPFHPKTLAARRRSPWSSTRSRSSPAQSPAVRSPSATA